MQDPPRHFIHYLPRRVVLRFPQSPNAPWFRQDQRPGDGFDRPARHTTRQKIGAAARVEPGDRIWIVSQIHSPWGRLPPGLDACLVVDRTLPREGGGFHYTAAQDSCWLPLADATLALQELETLNASGRAARVWLDPSKPIGHSLQSMRQLASAAPLEAWAEQVRLQPLNFISYRIADGTPGAWRRVAELLGGDEAVFWDRWCLPRRLAERRERVADTTLDAHLMQQLHRAHVVWGIETPLYEVETSYAYKERAAARQLGIYRPLDA